MTQWWNVSHKYSRGQSVMAWWLEGRHKCTLPLAIHLVILKWAGKKGWEQPSCCLITNTNVSKETRRTPFQILIFQSRREEQHHFNLLDSSLNKLINWSQDFHIGWDSPPHYPTLQFVFKCFSALFIGLSIKKMMKQIYKNILNRVKQQIRALNAPFRNRK